MRVGEYAQHWHDDGRGGGFCYGLVTRAGKKKFYVTWESGTRQRFDQGSHSVTLVPLVSRDVCEESLKRAGLVKASVEASAEGAPRQ